MKTSFIVAIPFILLNCFPLRAQFHYQTHEQQIHNQILNLSWPKNQPITTNSENGIHNWLKAYQAFVFQLTNNSEKTTEQLQKLFDDQMEHISDLKDTSPYYHFCLADIYLMKCYLYYTDNNYFKLISSFIKAKRHYDRNIKKFPHFLPNQKHVLIDKAALHLLERNISGNTIVFEEYWQTDLKIENEIESTNFFNREYFLLQLFIEASLDETKKIPFNFEPDKLIDKASEGPLETFAVATLFRKNRMYPDNLHVLHQADSLQYFPKMNLLNLLYGMALQNQLDTTGIAYLRAFINNQHQNNYIPYARLKLAWHYFLINDSQKLTDCIHKIKIENEVITSEDKQAMYEIKHTGNWIPEIIQSRLLFDAGNYAASANALLQLKNRLSGFNQEQKLEYAYRLGRAYDKMGKFTHAETFYKMVIYSGKDADYYYPSYSSFYLAEIYVQKHEDSTAKKYLQVCLQLDSPIYKQTIHQKAEELIEYLNKHEQNPYID